MALFGAMINGKENHLLWESIIYIHKTWQQWEELLQCGNHNVFCPQCCKFVLTITEELDHAEVRANGAAHWGIWKVVRELQLISCATTDMEGEEA